MQLSFVCTYNGCTVLPVQLKKCHEELNKRIYEHDKLVAEGSDKTDITLKVCMYIRTYVCMYTRRCTAGKHLHTTYVPVQHLEAIQELISR